MTMETLPPSVSTTILNRYTKSSITIHPILLTREYNKPIYYINFIVNPKFQSHQYPILSPTVTESKTHLNINIIPPPHSTKMPHITENTMLSLIMIPHLGNVLYQDPP